MLGDWNDPKSRLQQCCLLRRDPNEKEPEMPKYKYTKKTRISSVQNLVCTPCTYYVFTLHFAGFWSRWDRRTRVCIEWRFTSREIV